MRKSTEILMGESPGEWEGVDGKVKTITFSVTEDCNLACKYCYMTGKNHTKRMSFETAKKAVDYILEHRDIFEEKSVVWDFIGGEPFLEMELIDRICDYIKVKMFEMDHPWFNSYRFSFSTNGLLYNTPVVQNYIKKNHMHLSIGISVDGNKEKHDLQRIRKDGTGSYDDIVKIVPLWQEQFPESTTKATFAHDDLPLLKDSIISLWNLGIKNVSANVVFENVWEDGDDIIMEQQLKKLGDYVLEHELWKEYSVRFFEPDIGKPLSEEDKKKNFCGAGHMLAIDCDGNFSPCIRFLGVSLNHKKPLFIGNVNEGINEERIRPFLALDYTSQSLPECVNCDVATGCAWCQGCNYDMADTDTIYQRATYICKIHKATVRANKYFWNRFEKVTGLKSKRKTKSAYQNGEKYLQFITSDQITPHCSYQNERNSNQIMSQEILEKGIGFCEENGFIPAFIGEVPFQKEKYQNYIRIDSAGKAGNTVSVFTEQNCVCDDAAVGILVIGKDSIKNLAELLKKVSEGKMRVNLFINDLEQWDTSDIEEYKKELTRVAQFIYERYKNNERMELNVLTDIWDVKKMDNCDAGTGSFSLAPNGKIYICPAFYFDNPDNCIGTLEEGIHIKNEKLLELENAPICNHCDVYSCTRCKFQNSKITGEINTPSKKQCLVNHAQREVSRCLQEQLRQDNIYTGVNELKSIDYADPLEKLLRERDKSI